MLKYKTIDKEFSLEVLLQGDLDIEGTEVITDSLLPQLLKSQVVNLNFSEVPFVDSSGMGLLISLIDTLKENNIEVTISNIGKDVNEVFDLLQIKEIIGNKIFI
ncbi:STAS domain-containing protein [Gracilibacillus xinjiangensis]|uniref:Lipid asymmetry maintenance protein MlaB n=1 Tax=Gracilibacillus xinjiangensis TaxID=1193282 RepID=A0ABV8WP60_9BACI